MDTRSMTRSGWLLMAGLAIAGVLPTAAAAQTAKHPIRLVDMTDAQRVSALGDYARTPEDLGWIDAPDMHGVQLAYILGNPNGGGDGEFVYRLKFPADYEFAAHKYAGYRYVTVLQGTYHLGVGQTVSRSAAVSFGPGSFLVVPAGTPVFGWTEGETILQVHGNGPFQVEWLSQKQVADRN